MEGATFHGVSLLIPTNFSKKAGREPEDGTAEMEGESKGAKFSQLAVGWGGRGRLGPAPPP